MKSGSFKNRLKKAGHVVLTNVLPMLVSKGLGKLSVPCTGIPSSSISLLSSLVLVVSDEVTVCVTAALGVVDAEPSLEVSAPRATLPVIYKITLKMRMSFNGLKECRVKDRVYC